VIHVIIHHAININSFITHSCGYILKLLRNPSYSCGHGPELTGGDGGGGMDLTGGNGSGSLELLGGGDGVLGIYQTGIPAT
jgi:hypothetical protein